MPGKMQQFRSLPCFPIATRTGWRIPIVPLPLPVKIQGLVALALLPAFLGCSPPPPETVSVPRMVNAPTVKPSAADERWDIVYLHEQPVGWQVVRLYETEQEGKRLLAGEARSRLTVNRFGQKTSQAMTYRSLQTPDGEVTETRETVEAGTARSSAIGRRTTAGFSVVMDRGGVSTEAPVALPARCGGFFAIEWSLRARPLESGERRELRAFVPILNQVATITLEAGEWQQSSGSGSPQRLLRIKQQLQLGASPPMDSELLADEAGGIWESTVHGLGQRTRRVSQAEAMAIDGSSYLDLGMATTVPVTAAIESPETISRFRCRVSLPGRDPSRYFSTTSRQRIRRINAEVIDVEVAHGESETPFAPDTPPTPEDSTSSTLIQSDTPEIRELAAAVGLEGGSNLERARAIERHVYHFIETKDFSSALASAVEVARSRQGDCTEHAVLTAAICRACGIPARGVIGLLHVPAQNGFAFHMWNEAWVGTHWHPLDSTLPQGHIGALRLAVHRSGLTTNDTLVAFAPVLSLMGRLQIEVLEIVRDSPSPSPEDRATAD
jgi:hypothetical protein